MQGLLLVLAAEIARQNARIDALEAQLGQNSRNSHRPPSTDPPSAEKPKRDPSARKPGGQPGHPGSTRPLVPPERIDKMVDVFPERCGQCGEALPPKPEGEPVRHQDFEIPEIRPVVTEHRLHAVTCECCGAVTRADLPAGVPAGAFRPRLMALILLLRGAYRMSLRHVEEFFKDAFGVQISLGSLKNVEDKVSNALAPAVEEIHQAVKESSEPVSADETTHWEKGKRFYLWVAVTSFAAIFLIRARRTAEVAKELLGRIGRIVVTDRFAGYEWIPVWFRQVCLAHLRRDYRKMEDCGGQAGRIGAALGSALDEIFSLWHRFKGGTLARSTLRRKVAPLRHRIRELLLDGTAVAAIAGTCRKMLEVEPAMYTFVRVPGVEPTNNNGERALRHPVIWRKTSFGTWCEAGSRYAERILTVVATLRIQKRNVLAYLTEACRSAITGHAASSLLPQTCPAARPAA
jgi:transposase